MRGGRGGRREKRDGRRGRKIGEKGEEGREKEENFARAKQSEVRGGEERGKGWEGERPPPVHPLNYV